MKPLLSMVLFFGLSISNAFAHNWVCSVMETELRLPSMVQILGHSTVFMDRVAFTADGNMVPVSEQHSDADIFSEGPYVVADFDWKNGSNKYRLSINTRDNSAKLYEAGHPGYALYHCQSEY